MNDVGRPILDSNRNRHGQWVSTDLGLLVRLRDAADMRAWQEFSSCYKPLLHRAALRAGLAGCEAEEATQDTLVSVWHRMKTFRYEPERCSFKGWLIHLTRGHIRDHLRKRSTQARWFEPMDGGLGGPIEEVPDEAAEAAFAAVWTEEWRQQVLEAASRRVRGAVQPRHFEIWRLRFVEGLSVREVSERFGVLEFKVRLVSHRVARRLQQEIQRMETNGFRSG